MKLRVGMEGVYNSSMKYRKIKEIRCPDECDSDDCTLCTAGMIYICDDIGTLTGKMSSDAVFRLYTFTETQYIPLNIEWKWKKYGPLTWNNKDLGELNYTVYDEPKKEEVKMKKIITDNFSKTRDAVLIEKYFDKYLEDGNPLHEIIVENFTSIILAKAKSMEAKEKGGTIE